MGKAKPAAVIETLADLTPDPRNARRHNPRNVGMLEKALGEVGAARSIVIDERGVVLAGNATIEAAARAGIEKVQVVDADGETIIAVRRTGLTAKQKTRLALYDNRTAELADWDADVIADLLATERELLDGLFADDELAELLDDVGEPETTDAEPQMDRAAELNKKWQVQAGDLWRIGEHRLLCGDSTKREDVERVMGGEKARLVVTSPPYNQKLDSFKPSGMQKESPAFVNRMASAYSDSKPESEYQSEQVAMLELMAKHLAQDGSIFYNHKIRYRDKEVLSPMQWLSKLPFQVRQEIVWDRGSSITLNARMFIPADERIYWLRIGDEFVFNDEVEIKSWSSVWRIGVSNDEIVSAPFATEIPTRCIRAASAIGDAVIEPYCGSGTTMVACENLHRKCRGIEISPDYCAVILERMATAFPALAIERA